MSLRQEGIPTWFEVGELDRALVPEGGGAGFGVEEFVETVPLNRLMQRPIITL